MRTSKYMKQKLMVQGEIENPPFLVKDLNNAFSIINCTNRQQISNDI